jgi:hypothetical protein
VPATVGFATAVCALGATLAAFPSAAAEAAPDAGRLSAGFADAPAPISRAAYVGECCGGDYYYHYVVLAKLRVAFGGRALVGGPRGSYIACDQDGTLLALRPQRAVRIRRDGSFSFSGRRRALTLAIGKRRVFNFAVHGRFTSPDRARIVYSVSQGATAFGCTSTAQVLKLRRNAGEPPFIGCAAQPGKTLLSSADARVFEQRRVFYWAFLPFAHACLYSVDERVTLGPDGFDERGVGLSLKHFRLAGPYLAYGCGGNWMDRCFAGVRVVDLRDGSLRSPQLPAWVFNHIGWGPVPADVELKENGSVAWTIAGPPGWPREVGALDTSGQRLLDSGPNLDVNSLELNESTLTWLNDGTTRSTTLD